METKYGYFNKYHDIDLSITFSAVHQQKVVIPNKHGEKLVGILHDSGTKDIVVLCHGFRSTKVSLPDI